MTYILHQDNPNFTQFITAIIWRTTNNLFPLAHKLPYEFPKPKQCFHRNENTRKPSSVFHTKMLFLPRFQPLMWPTFILWFTHLVWSALQTSSSFSNPWAFFIPSSKAPCLVQFSKCQTCGPENKPIRKSHILMTNLSEWIYGRTFPILLKL